MTTKAERQAAIDAKRAQKMHDDIAAQDLVRPADTDDDPSLTPRSTDPDSAVRDWAAHSSGDEGPSSEAPDAGPSRGRPERVPDVLRGGDGEHDPQPAITARHPA